MAVGNMAPSDTFAWLSSDQVILEDQYGTNCNHIDTVLIPDRVAIGMYHGALGFLTDHITYGSRYFSQASDVIATIPVVSHQSQSCRVRA